ncbi:Zn-ribbon domain-containing OB-fold protein [Chloroflexota bacterium]
MAQYLKPIPVPNADTLPFWEGCKQHKLLIQRCKACGHHQFYPRHVCTNCMSLEPEFVPSTGRGEIYTFIVVHRAPTKVFEPEIPYVVAVIQLDEGVRMMSNIVDCPIDAVKIGMRVEVFFDDVSDSIALPRFKLMTMD